MNDIKPVQQATVRTSTSMEQEGGSNSVNASTALLQGLTDFVPALDQFLTSQGIDAAVEKSKKEFTSLSEKYGGVDRLISESMSGNPGEILSKIIQGLEDKDKAKSEALLKQLKGIKITWSIITDIVGGNIDDPAELAKKLKDSVKSIGESREQINKKLLEQSSSIVKASGKDLSFKGLLTQSIDPSGIDVNRFISEPNVNGLLESPLIDSNVPSNQPKWLISTLQLIQSGKPPFGNNLPSDLSKDAKGPLDSIKDDVGKFIEGMKSDSWDFTKTRLQLSREFASAYNSGGGEPKRILFLAMQIYVLDRAEKLSSSIIAARVNKSPGKFDNVDGAMSLFNGVSNNNDAFSKIQKLTGAISTLQKEFKKEAGDTLEKSALGKLATSAFDKFFNMTIIPDIFKGIVAQFTSQSKYQMYQSVLTTRVLGGLGKTSIEQITGSKIDDGKPREVGPALIVSTVNGLTEKLWEPYKKTFETIAQAGMTQANSLSENIKNAYSNSRVA